MILFLSFYITFVFGAQKNLLIETVFGVPQHVLIEKQGHVILLLAIH